MVEDIGLLVLRLVVGGLMIGHGAQKLFGWFGGYGFAGTSAYFGAALRLRPAAFWTFVAASSEFAGGLLFGLGLLNPLGAVAIIAAMGAAIVLAHWHALWAIDNGLEYPLVLAVTAGVVGLVGPGRYAFDSLLGIVLPAPLVLVAGIAAAAVTFAAALALRAPAAQREDQDSLQAAA